MKAMVPSDEEEKRQFILQLVARLRCTECGQPYNPHDFVLMNRSQDVWVLGIECKHCGGSGHVVVALQPDSDPEPVSDLTPEELEVATTWSSITVDDVLDMHMLLEEFDGDLELIMTR
jgi:DNA-directed RNA polymerase subunit RPC12/RpoP